MPHILVEGPIALADVARRHVPWSDRRGDLLVKFDRLYLDTGGRAALVEALVVDRGHPQRFFVTLQARDGGVMVRCEPLTDPEKTAGVKRALALVAERLRSESGGRYGTTNIAEFLVGAPGEDRREG
ncbi:MAG TPA: hypothetical protein VFD06_11150 [Candidatus Polarisedimenticolia bacterium]|nr:hypothetical protein [Candidatus Polarisedimenticolia bacterium]